MHTNAISKRDNDLILVLIRYGRLAVVQFLVEGRYCKPDATDNYGRTALHFAAW